MNRTRKKIRYKRVSNNDHLFLDLFKKYRKLSAVDFIGKHSAIFGMTNSGKTVTAARLAEQTINSGSQNLIFDVEGDYGTIQKLFPKSVVLYDHPKDEKPITDVVIRSFVKLLIDYRLSVIIVLKEYYDNEIYEIMKKTLDLLWKMINKRHIRLALLIFIDEAHKVIPQVARADSELIAIIGVLAKQGRKRGIGIVIISQRPSEVQKNVLAQTDYKFLHRVHLPHDIDAYNGMLNLQGVSSVQNRELIQTQVYRLVQGEAFFVFPAVERGSLGYAQVKVKNRRSDHPGATPGRKFLRPKGVL